MTTMPTGGPGPDREIGAREFAAILGVSPGQIRLLLHRRRAGKDPAFPLPVRQDAGRNVWSEAQARTYQNNRLGRGRRTDLYPVNGSEAS